MERSERIALVELSDSHGIYLTDSYAVSTIPEKAVDPRQ
jgi:hypothetical protein